MYIRPEWIVPVFGQLQYVQSSHNLQQNVIFGHCMIKPRLVHGKIYLCTECLWRNLNINELLITTFSISPSECRQQHKCGSSSSVELYKFAMVPLVTGQCRFSSALPNKYFSVFRILRVITPHRHPKCQYFLFSLHCTFHQLFWTCFCITMVNRVPSLQDLPQYIYWNTYYYLEYFDERRLLFFILSDYFSLLFMANYIVSSIPG